MKGRITAEGTDDANKRNKYLNFKNNPPFISCISKINNTFVDNGEDLDIVMPNVLSVRVHRQVFYDIKSVKSL